MLNFSGLAKAPAHTWRATLKPAIKKTKLIAEYEITVTAHDRHEAAAAAIKAARAEGFAGYAISKLTEIRA
jgi:hypothetical protein